APRALHSFPTRRSSDLGWLVLLLVCAAGVALKYVMNARTRSDWRAVTAGAAALVAAIVLTARPGPGSASAVPALAISVPAEQARSEEHTSELPPLTNPL